ELARLLVNERDPMIPGVWVSTDDAVHMLTCAGPHIDTLAHVAYDGRLWHGFPADSISETGTSVCGAETLPPIGTRGIVVDVGRLRGAHALDEVGPGHPITGEDLDAAMDAAGLEAQPGDVLLVRTGDVRHLKAGRRDRYTLGDQFRFSG